MLKCPMPCKRIGGVDGDILVPCLPLYTFFVACQPRPVFRPPCIAARHHFRGCDGGMKKKKEREGEGGQGKSRRLRRTDRFIALRKGVCALVVDCTSVQVRGLETPILPSGSRIRDATLAVTVPRAKSGHGIRACGPNACVDGGISSSHERTRGRCTVTEGPPLGHKRY